MTDELKAVKKELGFFKPPPDIKEAWCKTCDDQKSYDVFILNNGERRIGIASMTKEFGIHYYPHFDTVYRERCRSCFGIWEKKYRDTIDAIRIAKDKKDDLTVGELRLKLKQMQEMF
jgi:hypothetical protein